MAAFSVESGSHLTRGRADLQCAEFRRHGIIGGRLNAVESAGQIKKKTAGLSREFWA
jgi:hypothetical protein